MRGNSSTAVGDAARGLAVYRRTGEVDAIDQYARRLTAALADAGLSVGYASDGLRYADVRAVAPAWVLLHYNPFSYGTRGIAPRLVRDAMRLRGTNRTRLVILVHEGWVAISDWRSRIVAPCQRAQLMALVRAADTVIVTTERLARAIGHGAVHVPVSSNVEPVDVSASVARERLGIDSARVVALFGTSHPTRAHDYADAALEGLARRHAARGLTVLNLGAGAPVPNVSAELDIRTPGRLDDELLSLHLRASDLVLLPLTDGVSTRRTTLMAALAHGLAVVGLRDAHSDLALTERPEALVLTAVGDAAAFVSAAVELSEDADRLRATGAAARRLYEQSFDWPVVASRVASAICGVR